MALNFNGFNEDVVTFKCENTDVYIGTPVKMVKSGMVTACADGDAMIGVAVNVRNGYAAIQLSGYIEMPTDDEFEVGYHNISAHTKNKVKANVSGREYLVVYTNTDIVGFILK